ncbi:MAG: hypothetical protein OXL37_10375 [Chloroflexota bacterium]|nr:hypothetical protein [Chloroflexota bacterium]MDE2959736.1 hypothetical protein [Chloroflexota bacterium]
MTEQPVAAQLTRRTVPTALLTAAALTLALLVAVPVGILSARRRGSAWMPLRAWRRWWAPGRWST